MFDMISSTLLNVLWIVIHYTILCYRLNEFGKITWNAIAHLAKANCAVLVLSRQSTQFVLTIPRCRLVTFFPLIGKPLHLKLYVAIIHTT